MSAESKPVRLSTAASHTSNLQNILFQFDRYDAITNPDALQADAA
jgi:hypothetical protein